MNKLLLNSSNAIKSWSTKQKLIIVLSAVLVIAIVGGGLYYRHYNSYFEVLKRELQAEEVGDDTHPEVVVSNADKYLADFQYVAEINVDDTGFTPNSLAVKPNTKIVIGSKAESKHFLVVAPGGKSPEFFEQTLDVSKNAIFQFKLEKPGEYSFYDKYHPEATLVITVAE